MTTLHELSGDRQFFELRVPIDVRELAEVLASSIAPHLDVRPESKPEGFIDTAEALSFLGWGKKGYDRLLSLCQEDEIPHYRPTGSRLYFIRSELDAWVRERS